MERQWRRVQKWISLPLTFKQATLCLLNCLYTLNRGRTIYPRLLLLLFLPPLTKSSINETSRTNNKNPSPYLSNLSSTVQTKTSPQGVHPPSNQDQSTVILPSPNPFGSTSSNTLGLTSMSSYAHAWHVSTTCALAVLPVAGLVMVM